MNAQGDISYLSCKKGESLTNQVDYLFSKSGILLINANGNLYIHDMATKTNLPITAFDEVLFDNTQSEKHYSTYLQSVSSQEYGLMAVVDDEGIVLLNFEKVLWRYEHEWAYAGYVKLIAITQDHVIFKTDDPRYQQSGFVHIDLKTGNEV